MTETPNPVTQDFVADGPQPVTLAVFTQLAHLRRDWDGALILSRGLGPLGQAVALAANVAGATCLSLEADPATCRAAMRAGACDFLVNTVDEALRVLKNEIRQRRPLSVALELDPAAALGELLERGVLPQLFTDTLDGPDESVERFVREMQPNGMAVAAYSDSGPWLSLLREQRHLVPRTFSFETAAELKTFDTRLQALVSKDDPRQPWLFAAPRLIHRDRPYCRTILLTNDELAALT